MENQKFKDDIISDIIKKSAQRLPSDNFDDKVMSKIHYNLELKKQVSNPLKLSLVFFIAGTVLGIGATIFFMLYGDAILGFSTRDFGLIILFVICVVSIMSFDNLRRLISNYTT
jgi:F0F1-type ATP synthase assembly protein I